MRHSLLLILFLLSLFSPANAGVHANQRTPYELSVSSYGGQASNSLSATEIFTRARPSVVVILASNEKGQREALGSGFVVRKNTIATNHHVIEGMSSAFVVFSDGAVREVTGVIADSTQLDVILLNVETGGRPPLTLGDELELQQGDPVYAIGAPHGLELSLTNGIVSSFRNSDGQFLIQTTAAIAHGSSGGPLFDRTGRVAGITTSMISDAPGIYFSIGIGDVKRLLRTPQLVLMPLDEWAKRAARQQAPESNGANLPPAESDTDRIENLVQNNRLDEARAAVHSLLDREPDNSTAHRLAGEISVKSGDLEGAVHELEIAVQKSPKDALARFYYAIALFAARRFQEALAQEQTSYELVPTDADQPLLALLYYANQQYSQAESMARQALVSNSKNETALNVIAGLAFHGVASTNDRFADIVQRLTVADSNNFWQEILRGYTAMSQNHDSDAVAAFQAAERDDFPDGAPYAALSSLYLQNLDIGQASDQVTVGLSLFPEDPQLLRQGIFVSLLSRNASEARRRFEELERVFPGTRDTLAAGCLYYYGTEQSAPALSYCSRSVQESPNDHIAHSNYGWAALDANQFQLAATEFSKAYDQVSAKWNSLPETQVVDLVWGFLIADYYSGERKKVHKLLEIIRKSYPNAATVTGLQQMPLLWSPTTMARIETILRAYPK